MRKDINKKSEIQGMTRATTSSYKDDPWLRSVKSNIDKKIGSEGQLLAKKRVAALRHAHQMSEEMHGSSHTNIDTDVWNQLGSSQYVIANGHTYSPDGTSVNISGRISSIITHPTEANIIYIGAAQGGIWKTRDGGKTWSPKSDNIPDGVISLAIGALAIDETNPEILYAGTGEGNFAWDSHYGVGILKTTDGGETWTLKAHDIFINSRFCHLAINPKKSSTIFAATISIANPNIASGIYRSTDSGQNWTRMEGGLPSLPSAAVAETIGATDIVFDPDNPDTAYAAFLAQGIFKTKNANASSPKWEKLSIGLLDGSFGRISLGISKSSPKTLYALISNKDDVIDNLYETNDAGDSWKQITVNVSPGVSNGPNDFGTQGWYNLNVAVHPQDANIIYLSGISLWKGIRNKNSDDWLFSDIGLEIHPDNHSFAFNPKNPEIIYAGNDGGIYQSYDGGKSWHDDINQGLCITQFDFMEQHPTSEKIIFAGAQDNGTIRSEDSSSFYMVDYGDGGFVCVDPKQPKNIWHTYSRLTAAFSTKRGDYGTWKNIGDPLSGKPSNFNPPLALDKTNPNNIAIGGDTLYLDHSKGNDGWPEQIDFNFRDDDLISAINYVSSSLIFVGTNYGRIFRLTKHRIDWKIESLHAKPFPSRHYIWDMSLVPNDDTRLIVVISGFTGDVNIGHVYSCSLPQNGGVAAWTDISGMDLRLPDTPVNALVIDDMNPDTFYIGTDVGVFRTVDKGKKWTGFSKGLPNCQVYDMRLHSPSGLLRIITHGRGIWQRKVR